MNLDFSFGNFHIFGNLEYVFRIFSYLFNRLSFMLVLRYIFIYLFCFMNTCSKEDDVEQK